MSKCSLVFSDGFRTSQRGTSNLKVGVQTDYFCHFPLKTDHTEKMDQEGDSNSLDATNFVDNRLENTFFSKL